MAYTAWKKGAICTIGFSRSVAGAGRWGQIFFDYAHNGVTISQARDNANILYKSLCGSNCSNDSPTAPGNLVTFERDTIVLKL